MSNMPYQMVYSNCQNKGWSVSNFPKNLLGNSSSEKWQEPAMSSSTTQASLKILGEQKKFLPKYNTWRDISRGKEGDRSCKLPSLKSQMSMHCRGVYTRWKDYGQPCDVGDGVLIMKDDDWAPVQISAELWDVRDLTWKNQALLWH